MSELRIVQAPSAAPVLILDLWSAIYAPVAGTMVISTDDPLSQTGGAGQMALSESELDGRYEGYRTDYEKRTNGSIQWTCLVQAATPILLEQALAVLAEQVESNAPAFLEWQPLQQATPLFFERRGPGSWKPNLTQREQGVATVDVVLPVAPAVQGIPYVVAGAVSLPGVLALGVTPGTLTALLDVEFDVPALSEPLVWGMLAAWAPGGAPFGVYPASALTLTNLAVTADAAAYGGFDARVASAVAGTPYSIAITIDPSLMVLDPAGFECDVLLEVWLHAAYDSSLLPGTLLSLTATPPGDLGATRVSEDLPTGKALGSGAPGDIWWTSRAGVIRLPAEPGAGTWTIIATILPGPGSSALLAVDWMALVPARQRACSPTGVSPSGGYPQLLTTGAAQTKGIARDLSGSVAATGGVRHSDTGLGGAPLRLTPGAGGMLGIWTGFAVPDDPSTVVPSDVLAPSVNVRATVTPRYGLLSVP